MKGLKERLEKGEILIGTFLSLGNPITTEIVANAGFDFVVIDLEHGLGSEADVANQLLGLKNTNVSSIIRVESFQKQRIHRVLDLGADGIMCPQIANAEEAKQAVGAMRYPPEGIRGVAKMTRAARYGDEFAIYQEKSKEELLGIIQIETIAALDHLDEIANIDGVDVLFIGPSDLSMALGIFGQTDHPKFVSTVHLIVNAAVKAKKQVGILLPDPSGANTFIDMGIRFIACGTEAGFLNKAAKQTAEELRKIAALK